jgi:hypothetical protein
MRPERFMEFAVQTYAAAGLTAEPWQEGTERPFGVRVRLPGGAEVRHAITVQSADGDDFTQTEKPVEAEALDPVGVPELTAAPAAPEIERYLAALITNAGSREVSRVYGYSDRKQPSKYPGLGVEFHSGARIY